MDGFVGRVVNGKIFQNFASFIRGSSQSSKVPTGRPWTADLSSTADRRVPSSDLMGDNLRSFSSGRKRRASEADRAFPSQIPDTLAREDPQHRLERFQNSEHSDNIFHESRTSLAPQDQQTSTNPIAPPPLTSQYLKIFTFLGDDGEKSTGMAVTKNLVWQLNAIYRSEYKVSECANAIREIDDKLREWDVVVMDFRSLAADAATEQDRKPILVGLEQAESMVASTEQKRLLLEKKLQYWTDEKEFPLRQMLQNFKFALESKNLLEDILDDSEDKLQDFEDNQPDETAQPCLPSPSPSEVARQQLEDEKNEALEILHERRLNLQDAQAKIENWKEYCNDEYSKFLHLRSDGLIDATKTEFDVEMVQRGQVATRDCIEAEKELEQIIEYARLLKVDFEDFDQESGFASLIEDGHVESMDPAVVYTVDRSRIQRWMADDEKLGEPAEEMDEWECQTIGVDDSVSIVASQVATGKERKRIDRWRSMCELVEVSAQQEDNMGP
ncbi:hypothetical protein IFR05_009554 [Cadophora sp. M221]|nr:hypothetical protein IFR05_009554 [Cadophora sp. M221]